ncbi:MAG TPA: YifB family Mg chelatase-like AAA ATPase [Steroidobacteraceae bacterium]|nr:YifB family Mg chelatase-like AAA ATPase [Steroidobacteraceae bacterium]
MAFARVACRAQVGLAAPLVSVEVSLTSGLPAFCIVGLPAMVVRESRERVRAALLNSRFEFPAGRITVNLAPADLPKEGGRFDLPIALGLLLASRQLRSGAAGERAAGREFYGELGLTGELKAVPGLLPAAIAARHSHHELIVPRANALEACAVAPALTRAADHLLEVCAHVAGTAPLALMAPAAGRSALRRHEAPPLLDLADVRGQAQAKRALTIAAAGGHSLLLIGPPGCGKSMLAQRLPGLLPPLDTAEALEVAAIASVGGADFSDQTLCERPFRAPHHSATVPALVGGGARARPGEISLAHHGVLFLDELPEFGRATLEALREPLETGMVAVARVARETRYPAVFQLIAAMNPCPCGRRGDPTGSCRCSPDVVRRYLGRVSGPLLDRLDMQVEVPPVPAGEFDEPAGERSAAVAAAVRHARELQLARQGICNARLADTELPRCCLPGDARGRQVLETAVRRFGLSGRSRVRVLKVARTIADLDGHAEVSVAQLSEALMLRSLDRVAARASAAPSTPCSRRPA